MKKFILFTLICWGVPCLAWAVDALPFDQIFTGSRQLYSSTTDVPRYRLFLSAPKKINSRWQFDREERLSATVTAKTYELGERFTLDDAVAAVSAAVRERSARQVYMCDGLDCGSSNAWANEVFGVRQLYGLDQNQSYRVWDLNQERGTSFLVAYIVQRGNGRLYAQLEWVRLTGTDRFHVHASRDAILNTLKTQSYYVLADVQADIDALADALTSNPGLRVYIVGHAYGSGEAADIVARSERQAQVILEKLVTAGAKRNQVSAAGVGPYVPRRETLGDRVEVVLRF